MFVGYKRIQQMNKNMCTKQKVKFIYYFIKSSLLEICLFHNLKIYAVVKLSIFKQ
jgi:hypothetical protein